MIKGVTKLLDIIAQKVKFSTKNFFSKYEQTVDLLTFTREILTGKTLFFVQ